MLAPPDKRRRPPSPEMDRTEIGDQIADDLREDIWDVFNRVAGIKVNPFVDYYLIRSTRAAIRKAMER